MGTETRRTLGAWGEDLATLHLLQRGYSILDRNVRFRHGELDIVASEPGCIVFVEVKTRRSTRFGRAHEAVYGRKAQRLWTLAEAWLRDRRLDEHRCRFDVIAIEVDSDGGVSLRHITHAFTGDP